MRMLLWLSILVHLYPSYANSIRKQPEVNAVTAVTACGRICFLFILWTLFFNPKSLLLRHQSPSEMDISHEASFQALQCFKKCLAPFHETLRHIGHQGKGFPSAHKADKFFLISKQYLIFDIIDNYCRRTEKSPYEGLVQADWLLSLHLAHFAEASLKVFPCYSSLCYDCAMLYEQTDTGQAAFEIFFFSPHLLL